MDKCDKIEKRREAFTKIEMAPERWLLASDEKRVWKGRQNKDSTIQGGWRGNLILYLSSDVMLSIILNRLNYSCIYVLLIVFQSNVVPFFSMYELPNSLPLSLHIYPYSFPKYNFFDLFVKYFPFIYFYIVRS